jgi:hypothetical protein
MPRATASTACFCLGELAAAAAQQLRRGGEHFERIEDLVKGSRCMAELDAQTTVLVKGSRFMRMERVVGGAHGRRKRQCCLNSPNGWPRTSRLQRLRLHHAARRAGDHDRAGDLVRLRPAVIRWLTAKKIGQSVRDDGPQTHLTKAGTPTMGGALILIALGVTTCCGRTCPTASSGSC